MLNPVITEHQSFSMDNVIIYRGNVSQQEMISIMQQLDVYMMKNDLKKCGYIVTATHGVKDINGHRALDLEILLPIDKEVEPPENFKFEIRFQINNALKMTYTGALEYVNTTVQHLEEYIENNNLTATTPAYNVPIKEPDDTDKSNMDMEVDIYVGVSSDKVS